jgi:hypothetical protein
MVSAGNGEEKNNKSGAFSTAFLFYIPHKPVGKLPGKVDFQSIRQKIGNNAFENYRTKAQIRGAGIDCIIPDAAAAIAQDHGNCCP